MIPQTDAPVTFSVSALPEAVQQTFGALGLTFSALTVPQILAVLNEKYPQLLV